MQEKFCNTCQTIKPVILFSKNTKSKDGYTNECLECRQIREKKKYREKQNILLSEKYCPVCEITKDILEFKLEHRNEDGVASICVSCSKDKQEIIQHKHKLSYRCTKCEQVKNGTEFPTMKAAYTTIYPVCKECLAKQRHADGTYEKTAKRRIIRKATEPGYKEKLEKEEKIKHYKDPRVRILQQCKARAREKGWDFNLDLEDIVIPQICPILHVPLIPGNKNYYEQSPSIDRINNNFGYVKGNIQIISKKANSMKNSATPHDLIFFAEWINQTFKREDYFL